MKIKFLCLIMVFLCLFSVSVCAEEKNENFTLKLSEDYTTYYLGEDSTPMAKRLGMEAGELRSYIKENGVLMLALSKDKSEQIRITAEETEFSRLATDISALNQEALNQFAEVLTDKKGEHRFVTADDRLYINFCESLTDSGGSYCVTQYVTIANGKIYRFCFYNAGDTPSKNAQTVFAGFDLHPKANEGMSLGLTVVFVLAIALFGAISIAMIIGIIREKLAKNKENSDAKGEEMPENPPKS